MVQSSTPDLYSFIPEELWNGVKIGGNVYAVPPYKDSSITQFWYFDDQYVQKYNIDLDSIKTLKMCIRDRLRPVMSSGTGMPAISRMVG